jgi:DMSO/TMAO reductase YedYZ molybdopterin-dependent catalytic subunit
MASRPLTLTPHSRWRYWLPTVAATLVMLLSMVAARLVTAAPLPPEMLFNVIAQLLGVPWVFNLVHALPFGFDLVAKYVLFGFSFLGFGLLWLALDLLYPWLRRRLHSAGAALFYAAVGVLFTGLVLLPLQGLGLFGLSPTNFFYPPVPTLLWSAVFGLVFVLGLLLARPRQSLPTDEGRRQSLKMLLLALVMGKVVVSAISRAQSAAADFIAQLRGVSDEITSVRDHYVVSKNIFNPAVAESSWRLRITGLVENELDLTLEELRALPSVERSSTLICVSNQVGGDLIGNSVWTGVRLSDLLNMAGLKPGVEKVILRAADNYADSFGIASAFHEGVIVAYLHNGEPLTRDHGFPARLLIPEIYGMKNVKWLLEVELSPDTGFRGYWQQRGWSDSAVVKTMSRVDTGEVTRLSGGAAAIGGIAWAGVRGIDKVEVSIDGGESWQEAEVKPALNDISWNLWGFRWEAAPGTYEVLVRATDGSGELQTAERTPPLPDGASGYHRVRVRVP